MTAFTPILRFVVYANETGSVPLQAPATAPHQDNFMVASRQGISGYQPYIYAEPQIDGQSLTLPEFASTVGSCKIQIGDFRTGTSQFDRWATAFVGRSTQQNLLLGKRCYLDVSYDDGTTYEALYAGRIARAEMQDIVLNIEVQDVGFDMKQTVFTGARPMFPFVTSQLLYPVGVSENLSTLGFTGFPQYEGPSFVAGKITNTGRVQRVSEPLYEDGPPFLSSTNYQFTVAVNLQTAPLLTTEQLQTLESAIASTTVYYARPNGPTYGGRFSKCFVRIFSPNGNAYGYMTVIGIKTRKIGSADSDPVRLTEFTAMMLPDDFAAIDRVTTSDIPSFPINQAVTFQFANLGPPSEDSPFYLRAFSVGGLISTVLNGDANYSMDSGSRRLYVPTGSLTYTELPNTTGFPLLVTVTAPQALDEFLKESVCKPFQVGYRNEIGNIGGVTGSYIAFFPTARPDTAPSVILDETDILTDTDAQWFTERSFARIAVTTYEDSTGTPINSKAITDDVVSPTGASFSGGTFKIDGNALHYPAGVRQFKGGYTGSVPNYAKKVVNEYLEQYGRGKTTFRLAVRRNAKTTAIKVGQWVLVDTLLLPNPSTQRRGGQRLMMVTGISPKLDSFGYELLDGGLSSATASPTGVSGSIVSGSSTSLQVVWTSTTRVEVNYAIHPDGVGSISANSPLWTFAGYSNAPTDQAVLLTSLNAGRFVSIRVRGISDSNATLSLPSPWVTISPIQMPVLAPPTSLAVSGITLGQAIFSWQTGSALPVELLVRSPNTNPFTASLVTLPAGSTRYVMQGVETYPSTTMGIGVRHIDSVGSTSVITSASWTATGTSTPLPSMSFFYTYLG